MIQLAKMKTHPLVSVLPLQAGDTEKIPPLSWKNLNFEVNAGEKSVLLVNCQVNFYLRCLNCQKLRKAIGGADISKLGLYNLEKKSVSFHKNSKRLKMISCFDPFINTPMTWEALC